jgi:hypothetical protein
MLALRSSMSSGRSDSAAITGALSFTQAAPLRGGGQAQVARDAGLRDVHGLDEVADGAFAVVQDLDEAVARRVGEAAKTPAGMDQRTSAG